MHSSIQFFDAIKKLIWKRYLLISLIQAYTSFEANWHYAFKFMVFTQAKAIYILKSSLTPQSKHKEISNTSVSVSVSAAPSLSTTPTCTNRKSKGANKNSNNKSNGKQHLTVNVCCRQPIVFSMCWENYIYFIVSVSKFLVFKSRK